MPKNLPISVGVMKGMLGASTTASASILQIPESAEHKHKDNIPKLSAQKECPLLVDIMICRNPSPSVVRNINTQLKMHTPQTVFVARGTYVCTYAGIITHK